MLQKFDSPEDTKVIILDNSAPILGEEYDPVYSITEHDDYWIIEGISHNYSIPKFDSRSLKVILNFKQEA